MIGTLSTSECSDVAEKILQYLNCTPPPLFDCSSSSSSCASNGAASSVPPPHWDHVTSPLSTSKSLPHGLLGHMTSSSTQFSDHVIQPPRLQSDVAPKLPPLPNPTTNNDRYANVAITTSMIFLPSL